MARITQNRPIALFSLWSFNQSKAGKEKKDVEIFALQKEKILYDNQSIIKSTHIS